MNGSLRIAAALLAVAHAVTLARGEASRPAAPPVRFEGVARVCAVGDIHGAYEPLVAILRAAELIDERGAWSGGAAHLVLLGDLVDRGPRSRDVIELVQRLEGQAARAGGRVHVLLGNHEVMNLVGDLRYVTPEEFASWADLEDPAEREAAFARFAARSGTGDARATRVAFERRHPPGWFGHRRAFRRDGPVGRWLLERPAIVVIDRTAFVHGGLPPIVAELGLEGTVAEVRRALHEYLALRDRLVDDGLLSPETSYVDAFPEVVDAYRARGRLAIDARHVRMAADVEAFVALASALPMREDGPLWYRKTATAGPEEEATLAKALRALGADRVVVGHTRTPEERIVSRAGGRVILADTGMLASVFKGRPAAVLIESNETTALYADTLRREPIRPLGDPGPAASSDAEIERFLATAEVVSIEDIGRGVTEPRRVALRAGERHMRAIFKSIDRSIHDVVRVGRRREIGFTDRYHHEIAAYRVDRLLGLRLVPVTVERRIGDEIGSLQAWIEGAVDDLERRRLHLDDLDAAAPEARRRMRVFDALIYNTDRNASNVLVRIADGTVHLIDHSRAFRLQRELPPGVSAWMIRLDEELAARLKALDRATLEARLGDVLSRAQIGAILARRDLVLELAARNEGVGGGE